MSAPGHFDIQLSLHAPGFYGRGRETSRHRARGPEARKRRALKRNYRRRWAGIVGRPSFKAFLRTQESAP